MTTVPIPATTASEKSRLNKLAERAADLAGAGKETALTKVEEEINDIVYHLFDLTSKEIAQIEAALANTRASGADDDEGGLED